MHVNFEEAQDLLNKYVKNDNLKKHCYAVESCMRYYAKKLEEDVNRWACTGL